MGACYSFTKSLCFCSYTKKQITTITINKLNEHLNTHTKRQMNKIIKNFKNNITLEGDICDVRKTKYRTYFILKNNNNTFKCVYAENNTINDNIHCYVIGKLCTDTYNNKHEFYLRVSEIKYNTDTNTSIDELIDAYLPIIKKSINFANIKSIGIISKIGTQGYNDFINQFIIPNTIINVKTKNITLEGINTKTELVKAIDEYNNEDKCVDVIIIIRGGGSTADISISYDCAQVFDAIIKSNIPIITAIGHDLDKGKKLLITEISDMNYSTPSSVALDIMKIYNTHIMNKYLDKAMIIRSKYENIINTRILVKQKKMETLSGREHIRLKQDIRKLTISLKRLPIIETFDYDFCTQNIDTENITSYITLKQLYFNYMYCVSKLQQTNDNDEEMCNIYRFSTNILL